MKESRPPVASLACVNPDCDLYGQKGCGNLIIRKVYGRDQIRYLRCHRCQQEFSERKNTALWNNKIPEAKAVSLAEHLAEGCHIKRTARLVKVDPGTVRRLNRKVGKHGQRYHEQEAQDVIVTKLQADERYGFAGSKQQPVWEAELIDPESKFILAHVQGAWSETLIRWLLEDGASRLFTQSPRCGSVYRWVGSVSYLVSADIWLCLQPAATGHTKAASQSTISGTSDGGACPNHQAPEWVSSQRSDHSICPWQQKAHRAGFGAVQLQCSQYIGH